MLKKHCARHGKSSAEAYEFLYNCHAKWSLPSSMSGILNLQPFHRFSVRHLKHQPHKARNPCACRAKSILADPSSSNLPHLPGVSQPSRTAAPATRHAIEPPKTSRASATLTSKSLPRHSVVQILATSWAAERPQLPFFGADFASQRSHEPMEKRNISRNSYLPKLPRVIYLWFKTCRQLSV